MLHVPQINIIDTKSGTAVAYQLNYHMTLSDLETYEDLKTYFIRICADNEYIYTVFYGKEPWGLYDIPCVNQIYIFDWNGNLIKKILTKHCIDHIAVDHVNKILYTTSPMDEKLYYIKRINLHRKHYLCFSVSMIYATIYCHFFDFPFFCKTADSKGMIA